MKRPDGFDERSEGTPVHPSSDGAGRTPPAGRGQEARRAPGGPAWLDRVRGAATRVGASARGTVTDASDASAGDGPPAGAGGAETATRGTSGATDRRGTVPPADGPPGDAARTARDRAHAARRAARRASADRRRSEKGEVRRFTRRSRHRRAVWLWSGGVLVGLVAAVAVTVFSPLRELRTITVEGTQRIDPAAVQAALGDQLGTPLALVDQGRVEDVLEGFPLVASYVTETVPPHTLVVRLSERRPVAVVAAGDRLDLVDPAGVVLQQVDEQPEGVPLVDVGSAPFDGPLYRAVAEVLLALPVSLRSTVDQASATTADDVTLTLTTGETVVWGSADRSGRKAQVLSGLVADQARRDPGAAVEYDVSAPDNGIIRTK